MKCFGYVLYWTSRFIFFWIDNSYIKWRKSWISTVRRTLKEIEFRFIKILRHIVPISLALRHSSFFRYDYFLLNMRRQFYDSIYAFKLNWLLLWDSSRSFLYVFNYKSAYLFIGIPYGNSHTTAIFNLFDLSLFRPFQHHASCKVLCTLRDNSTWHALMTRRFEVQFFDFSNNRLKINWKGIARLQYWLSSFLPLKYFFHFRR